MWFLIEHAPALITMAVLLLASGFFSLSEAAFFYLSQGDRRRLLSRGRLGKLAVRLTDAPEQLLSTILFWNLLVNLTYFTVSSATSFKLEEDGHPTTAALFALSTLIFIIIFGEMLPKSLGILQARNLAVLWSVPLTAAVRAARPFLPILSLATLLSRRLFFPFFQPEPYLRVSDLERAVRISANDEAALKQEHRVLQNIVLLSELRAEEMMRPRTQFIAYPPPVTLEDLKGRMPRSGYLLITEPETDEIASAIPLKHVSNIPGTSWDHTAAPVAYVPWSSTVAQTLDVLHRTHAGAAAVVNEHGETIGILTYDDILDALFGSAPSRSWRLLRREPIRRVGRNRWILMGMAGTRQMRHLFRGPFPQHQSTTLSGILQEILGRLPEEGDTCRWGPLRLEVKEVRQLGQVVVEAHRVLHRTSPEAPSRETPEEGPG